MARLHLFLAAILILCPGVCFGDDTAATQPSNASGSLTLTPGPDIILATGEQVHLTVFDSSTQKPVQVGKIDWAIDEKSPSELAPEMGAVSVPDDNPFGAFTIYKAPDKIPAKNVIEVKASISGGASPVTLVSHITIISDPNWFVLDGDTGFGRREVVIELDPKFHSHAGTYDRPDKLLQGQYLVDVMGNVKGESHAHATISLNLGNQGTPGTHAWSSGRGGIHASVVNGEVGYLSFSLEGGSRGTTFPGSTTLLDPDPADTSGLVRGFFSGEMVWFQLGKEPKLVQGHRVPNFITHHVTVRGHFGVPKGGQ